MGTPTLVHDFDADASLLVRYVAENEKILTDLPDKSRRDAAQQRQADEAHRRCRALRARFIGAHAAELYERLTDSRRTRLRPTELAGAAARLVPGLVPDGAQLADERGHLQHAKEGREIDQGVLFWGLLQDPGAGPHLVDSALTPTPRALATLPQFRAAGAVRLDTVAVARQGSTGHVTLANTMCLNAEDDQLAADLETAVDLVLLDDQIRVCVLRGAPMTHPRYAGRRVFCAGLNLTKLYHGQISFVGFLLGRELGPIHKILRGVRVDDGPGPQWGLAKPWIGAVDGFAIGGGLQMLLTLDRVLAADDAYFRLPAAEEGIVPGTANLRLTRLTGGRIARAILAGRMLPAGTPEARHLCDKVVPADEMDRAVERAAADLATGAAVSNRHLLHLAEEPVEVFRRYMAAFAWEQPRRLHSPEVLTNLERGWMSRRGSN